VKTSIVTLKEKNYMDHALSCLFEKEKEKMVFDDDGDIKY
jgi:hypothetical protein